MAQAYNFKRLIPTMTPSYSLTLNRASAAQAHIYLLTPSFKSLAVVTI
jgi:hypothetical protein